MAPAKPTRITAAARRLHQAHRAKERFAPLPGDLAPRSREEAYGIQDAFVAMRAEERGPVAGYKIALSTPQMRQLVGLDIPVAGVILESTLLRSPARVRARDYVRLIVEFEIAVELAEDLPAADAPFSRKRVAEAVGAVMPAFELADDRGADYAELPRHPLDLVADNAWNEGAVLGSRTQRWHPVDLAGARGVARINGDVVGEGRGRDAMGHPFDAVAWIAGHLAAERRGLVRGDIVLTGSLVTTKAVKPGDEVSFELDGLGRVELRVE